MSLSAIALGNVVDNILNFEENNSLDTDQIDQLQNSVRECILQLQVLALAADVDAQGYLANKRRFLKNTSGSPQTVVTEGRKYVFPNGQIACTDLNEKTFFINKNSNMTESTPAAYFAGGTARVFYW